MDNDTKAPAFGLRLPQDILDCIDTYRMALPYPPSRSKVLQKIITDWAESRAQKLRVPLEE
jgi:hypothetical protein